MAYRMRLLFVTPAISWPLSFGGDIRRWNVLQGLLQAGTTDALVFRRGDAGASREAFAGCRQLFEVAPGHLDLSPSDAAAYERSLGRGRLVLTRRAPFEYLMGGSESLHAQIAAMLDWRDYQLVWISTARLAKRLALASGTRTVLDGDDFAYVRNWYLLRNSPWYGAKVWNYLDMAKLWWHERRLHREHEAVVRCSAEDRARHAAPNVYVIPNGTTIPPPRTRMPSRRVLFVGDLGYEPNRQGVEWFLERVWPQVRAALPDAAFDLAGRNASQALRQLDGRDGIRVHGFVDDLGQLYDLASLSIVPLLAGGGTRLKILESLAHATPVVATSLGAFGVPAHAGEGLVRADNPLEFARQCIAHLSDAAAHQPNATAGRRFVQQHYDWQNIRLQVADLVRQVAGE